MGRGIIKKTTIKKVQNQLIQSQVHETFKKPVLFNSNKYNEFNVI